MTTLRPRNLLDLVLPGLFCPALLLLGTGCLSTASKEPQTAPLVSERWTKPPEGEWLVDERGREYYVMEARKDQLIYYRPDDTTIRLRSGVRLTLIDEDEETFYIKIYRTGIQKAPPAIAEPSEEQLSEVAATYEVDLDAKDTLELQPFDEGLPKKGLWRNGFDLADMNGDGHIDIVHAPPRKTTGGPWIFLGDGAGTWQLWQEARFPDLPYTYGDAAAADFDGDGNMDLALGMHMTGITALRGDGRGQFETWSEGIELSDPEDATGTPPFSSRTIDVVDWDDDGDTDIVALAEGPRGFEHVDLAGSYGKVVYLNQGDGTWVKKLDESKVFGDSLVIADLNRDGRADFFTASNVGGTRTLLNLGQEDGSWTPEVLEALRPRSVTWAVAGGDFDGDGNTDLAVAFYAIQLGVRRAGIDVLYNRPDGEWERRPVMVTEGKRPIHIHSIGSGDLDGDGAVDLVASSRHGHLFVFRGDGKGYFQQEKEVELGRERIGCRGYQIRLADIDGDNRDEILTEFSGERCPDGGSFNIWRAVPRASGRAARRGAS